MKILKMVWAFIVWLLWDQFKFLIWMLVTMAGILGIMATGFGGYVLVNDGNIKGLITIVVGLPIGIFFCWLGYFSHWGKCWNPFIDYGDEATLEEVLDRVNPKSQE
jgi:hypothetical protein